MKWWAKSSIAAASLTVFAASWVVHVAWGLPSADSVRTRLFSGQAPKGEGTWLPLWAISPKLQTAVVLWEDPSFFHHAGLDYSEILRAAWSDLHTASYRRGASTITQQVAKNLFLSPEKTIRRKVREAILARRIERALSKEEILTVYLNMAEWGDEIIGAEAASRRYFSKAAADLDWAEAAMLAGILPNPRQWNPCRNPSRAIMARRAVLTKLLSVGDLNHREFQLAEEAPIPPCLEPVVAGPSSTD